MNLDYKELIPENFNDFSKVWIYQSNRMFLLSEALELENILENFCNSWNSHGTSVKGFATLLFGQFIILMADETNTQVGGCSTDSSIHAMKAIEKQFSVSLFDRQLLAFYVKDKIQTIPLTQLQYAIENNFVSQNTLYFNNLVSNKKDFMSQWIVPIKNSWLEKKLNSALT